MKTIQQFQSLASACHVGSSRSQGLPLPLRVHAKGEARECIRQFSTLGGLIQHLESGRCESGLEIYSKAIAFVEERLRILRFADIKLLSPEVVNELHKAVS